jgi:hypothetical protein
VIGLDPAKFVDWDPEPIQAGIARGRARFDDLGIEADWCLLALDEDPEGPVVEALTRNDRHAADRCFPARRLGGVAGVEPATFRL